MYTVDNVNSVKEFLEAIGQMSFVNYNNEGIFISNDEELTEAACKAACDVLSDSDFAEQLLLKQNHIIIPILAPSLNNNYDAILLEYVPADHEVEERWATVWLPSVFLHNHNLVRIFGGSDGEDFRGILEMLAQQHSNYMKEFDFYRRVKSTVKDNFAGIAYVDIAVAELN